MGRGIACFYRHSFSNTTLVSLLTYTIILPHAIDLNTITCQFNISRSLQSSIRKQPPPPPSTRPQVLTFDELILSLPLSLVCLDSTFFKIDELHIILIYSVTCVTTVLLHSNGYKAPRRNTSWDSTKNIRKRNICHLTLVHAVFLVRVVK